MNDPGISEASESGEEREIERVTMKGRRKEAILMQMVYACKQQLKIVLRAISGLLAVMVQEDRVGERGFWVTQLSAFHIQITFNWVAFEVKTSSKWSESTVQRQRLWIHRKSNATVRVKVQKRPESVVKVNWQWKDEKDGDRKCRFTTISTYFDQFVQKRPEVINDNRTKENRPTSFRFSYD
jgi:hypothetical protein